MNNDAEIGSLAEETAKLFAVLTDRNSASETTSGFDDSSAEPGSADAHRCPHGWCPLCRVADVVAENPELLDGVRDAAFQFAASVMELFSAVVSERDDE